MKYLGVDLGFSKTGLSISEGNFASPYKTIVANNLSQTKDQISEIVKSQSIEKIIIGIPEGEHKEIFEKFAKDLKQNINGIEVIGWDETLTTRQARDTMIKLQTPQRKKKEKEHEIAASLILQSYLDANS